MVGSDSNLIIKVGAYVPQQVECRGQFQPWRSCRELLCDMPVISTRETFGPVGDPLVDVALPLGVISGK